MGNFFRMINIRWSREEIAGWGSLRKTAYLLLPLLFYFLVHDGAEILLWAGLDGIMTSGSKSLTSFLTDNAYTVNGLINGIAILAGVGAIWRAIRGEIREEDRKGAFVTDYMVLGALALLTALGLNLLFSLLGLTGSSQG